MPGNTCGLSNQNLTSQDLGRKKLQSYLPPPSNPLVPLAPNESRHPQKHGLLGAKESNLLPLIHLHQAVETPRVKAAPGVTWAAQGTDHTSLLLHDICPPSFSLSHV